jgi:hypothetical protein
LISVFSFGSVIEHVDYIQQKKEVLSGWLPNKNPLGKT